MAYHSDLTGTNDWSTLFFATGLLIGLIGGSMAGRMYNGVM